MAVPKKKKSKSRRNMRRASNGSYALDIANVLTDKTTGEFKLSHHISLDGYYKGRQIVKKKERKAAQEE